MQNLTLHQLNEMNSKAQRLVELMKKGIVEFLYVKKSTGKPRKAKGTLKRDLIPPEAQRKRGRPKKRPDDLVIYYDTGKHAIRSFKDYLLKKVISKDVQSKKQTISKPSKDVNSSNALSKQKQQNKTARKDGSEDNKRNEDT